MALPSPSNIGGAHWGGVAFDPSRQLAIVPVNSIAAVVQLIPRATYTALVDTLHDDAGWAYAPMRGTPYGMRRTFFLSTAGVPCTPPPGDGPISRFRQSQRRDCHWRRVGLHRGNARPAVPRV
jgi:glucose dehydrogenase